MKHPYPVVEIIWLDAQTTASGWQDTEEHEIDIPEVMTIGFLIKENDEGLMVASTACKELMTNSRICIPRGMVKSIKYLRGKPKAAGKVLAERAESAVS